MAFNRLEVNDLATAALDDSDQIIVGESNKYKKATVSALKNNILGSAPSYTTDTEPYLMRRTAHVGVVGKESLEKIVGGTIAWNQVLSQSGLSSGTVGGITLVKNSNGSVTLTGARTGENVNFNCDYAANVIKYKTGHVYYLPWSGVNGIGLQIIMESDVGADSLNKNRLIKVMATASTRSWARIRIGTPMNENIGTVTYFPQILDITQMFGATIADYAANLENTYGTGVAWLSKYIDLSTYHAYDAGSIQSVQATAHVMTGFNQFDEVVEAGYWDASTGQKASGGNWMRCANYIPVLPNTEYKIHFTSGSGSQGSLIYLDGNKSVISYISSYISTVITTPSNCRYMVFYANNGWFGGNICINISKPTGSPKNGDYVPYNGHTYPLGSDTLRGYPMLVNNKLAFDGDEKYPNGTTKRKYGIVDLGTLPWTKYNVAEGTLYRASINTIKRTNAPTDVPNIVCSHYPVKSQSERAEKTISQPTNNSAVDIIDSTYTDATAFKTAMSGVYLVYPLATETTESSTSFQKIQTIDADGTESFTTSSPVPVGHETQTPDNILAALSWVGE